MAWWKWVIIVVVLGYWLYAVDVTFFAGT